MDDLSLQVPTDIVFGLDVINRVGHAARERGKRALLVTESVLSGERPGGSTREHLKRRGVETIVFDEIGSSSTTRAVERALALSRASRVELVIGLGGIRALSCAKSVARLSPSTVEPDHYFSNPASLTGFPSLPYIEVPTTGRSPFLLNDQCLLVDARDRRAGLYNLGKYADNAIVDPALALSLSEKSRAAILMDTLLSAIEAYFSRKSTFLSETLSLRAVGIIASILDDSSSHLDDRTVCLLSAQAGLLVALSLTMSTQGVGSAVAYALGGKYQVPKSMISAVMVPYVLDRGMLSQPGKVDRIGRVLGQEIPGVPPVESAAFAADVVRRWLARLELPARLKDLGVSSDDLVEISRIAYSLPMTKFLFEPMSAEDIYTLLKEVY